MPRSSSPKAPESGDVYVSLDALQRGEGASKGAPIKADVFITGLWKGGNK